MDGKAIGVILTGSGTDGTTGIKAIKEKGGTTIAQDPDTAEHNSMPASAIATGMVDFILPLADIASAITTLITKGGEE
jgi:chemotaxis response regulator CheB